MCCRMQDEMQPVVLHWRVARSQNSRTRGGQNSFTGSRAARCTRSGLDARADGSAASLERVLVGHL